MHRSTPHAQPHKPAHARRVRGAERGRRPRRAWFVVGVLVIVAATTAGIGVWLSGRAVHAATHGARRSTSTGFPVATVPSTTTTTTTTTIPPTTLPAVPVPCTPAPVPGGVYAVGDSVLI